MAVLKALVGTMTASKSEEAGDRSQDCKGRSRSNACFVVLRHCSSSVNENRSCSSNRPGCDGWSRRSVRTCPSGIQVSASWRGCADGFDRPRHNAANPIDLNNSFSR